MVNPIKGEVNLVAGGETYRLRLSIDAIVQVEDLMDVGILELVDMLNTPAKVKAGTIRGLLWGALREHHNGVDVVEAGNILGKAGLTDTVSSLAEAMQAAFPKAEGKQSPSRKRGRAGTGKAST